MEPDHSNPESLPSPSETPVQQVASGFDPYLNSLGIPMSPTELLEQQEEEEEEGEEELVPPPPTPKELLSQQIKVSLLKAAATEGTEPVHFASFEVFEIPSSVTVPHPQLRDSLQTHPLFPGKVFFLCHHPSSRLLLLHDDETKKIETVIECAAVRRFRYFRISNSGKYLMIGGGYRAGFIVIENWRSARGGISDRSHPPSRICCAVGPGGTANYGRFLREDEDVLCVAAQSRTFYRYRLVHQIPPTPPLLPPGLSGYKLFGSALTDLIPDSSSSSSTPDAPFLGLERLRGHVVGSYPNCVCETHGGGARNLEFVATPTDGAGYQLFTDRCRKMVYTESGYTSHCDYVEFSSDDRYFLCCGSARIRVFETCDVDSLPFTRIYSHDAGRGNLSLARFHPLRPEVVCFAVSLNSSFGYIVLADVSKSVDLLRLEVPFRFSSFDFEKTRGSSLYFGVRGQDQRDEPSFIARMDLPPSFFTGTQLQDKMYSLQQNGVLADAAVECVWD